MSGAGPVKGDFPPTALKFGDRLTGGGAGGVGGQVETAGLGRRVISGIRRIDRFALDPVRFLPLGDSTVEEVIVEIIVGVLLIFAGAVVVGQLRSGQRGLEGLPRPFCR